MTEQTFIVDTANAYTRRKNSKRDFLSKMGMAGIGMSAFATGMFRVARALYRGNVAHAAAHGTPPGRCGKLPQGGR